MGRARSTATNGIGPRNSTGDTNICICFLCACVRIRGYSCSSSSSCLWLLYCVFGSPPTPPLPTHECASLVCLHYPLHTYILVYENFSALLSTARIEKKKDIAGDQVVAPIARDFFCSYNRPTKCCSAALGNSAPMPLHWHCIRLRLYSPAHWSLL